MMGRSDCGQLFAGQKFFSRSHDAVIRGYDECAEKLQNSAVGV